VAAALAQGAAIKDLGPALPLARVQRLELPQVESVDGVVQGQVLAVDHFGNVRTSIRCGAGFFNTRLFSSLEIQGHRITQLVRSYSEVVAGGLAVLVDSSGFLEIAANQASAAALIGCVPGNVLTMEFRRQLRG
jgi:S-adenosylmethionine hydrolase